MASFRNCVFGFTGALGIIAAGNANAASLSSVMSALATESGQIGISAEYQFSLPDARSDFTVVDNGDAIFGVGDILNTNFSFASISTTSGAGTFSTTLDASVNVDFASLGGFNSLSTLAVFGQASFLITDITGPAITVAPNIASIPNNVLFEIYQLDDPSSMIDLTSLPASPPAALFAKVGTDPIVLQVQSANLTNGDLVGVDISAITGGYITEVNDELIAPSNVAITGGTTSANGVFTITAIVTPSPATAGLGLFGLAGLTARRRRSKA